MTRTILIADDHPVTAEGIQRVLRDLRAHLLVAFTPEEVRRRLTDSPIDLLVLDISFRDSPVTGFDVLREAHQAHPRMPILMLSMYDDEAVWDVACKEGARGFISKMSIGSQLLEAVQVVLEGGVWFPKRKISQGVMLTSRQLEVAHELRQGLNEKETAAVLGVSVRTVENHLKKAKASIKAKSLGHFISIFVERGYRLLPHGGNGRRKR